MIVELAAVRLLAPWFGTSLVVWTNVIAAILLALTLGYLAGGMLSRRASPIRLLSWTLLAAGALVSWLPFLCSLWAPRFLPEQLALDEAASLVLWGSLAVSLLVFLPPAILLGAVCPLAVEAVAEARGSSAGGAGGAVLAASTLGSLLGVFGTSHLFLPSLGLARTFLLAGALLVAAGVGLWLPGRRSTRTTSIGVLIALASWGAALASGEPERPRPAPGLVTLAVAESPYQSLRVVEDRTRDRPLRFLQVNEGFDSFQSVWQSEPGLLPEGFYYNDFLLPCGWGAPGPWRVLVLGLGAGTVLRVFDGATPHGLQPTFVGVELDPVVVDLGRSYFGLTETPDARVVWSGLDARLALRVRGDPFDQIILDCYANQIEIPPHLCTEEFFREASRRLAEGGWLVANLGGFGFDDPVVLAVSRTCANAFGAPVLLLRVPRSRNYTLLARRGTPLPLEEMAAPAVLPGPLDRLLAPRALPDFVCLVEPAEGQVLTDDRCPIERLQVTSLLQARKRRSRPAAR